MPRPLTSAVRRLVAGHLAWVFRSTRSHPLRVGLSAFILLLLGAVSIATTRFETDVFKLFPAKEGPLRLFLDSLEWTGGAREAVFLLEGDRKLLPAETDRFAEKLRELRIDGVPAFRKVTARAYDPAEAPAFAQFIGYAAFRPELFLDPGQVEDYLARLSPEGIERSLERSETELAGQMGSVSAELVAADPLYLRDLIGPRLRRGASSLALDPRSPYLSSLDGSLYIVVAEPDKPVQDMAFARKLVKGIDAARRGAPVSITCTGAHINAVIDEAAMKGNIAACILSSLLVVLALFYGTYRRLLPTLLLPLIICCGVVLALGVAGLILPSVHIISFAFMALIIGLGTDYSIHIYDRFHTERAAGAAFEEALQKAVVETGHGIFTAATTTALPFLALTLSDVRALFELGLLVGLGVIFTMYATFFFLPPLLLFMERRFPDATYHHLSGFGLTRLWRLGRNRPSLVRLATLALFLLFTGAACFISFEGELKNLQPRHSEAFLAQEKLERHLSLAPKQMLVALDGQDPEELLKRGERVSVLTERYRSRGELVAVSSLDQIVNNREVHDAVARKVRDGLAGRNTGEDIKGALEKRGFAVERFAPALNAAAALRQGGHDSPLEAIKRLGTSPLRGLVERHLVRDANGYHLLIHLFYRGEEFPQERFLAELAATEPTARATGVDLVSQQLSGSVRKSFLQGFAIGGILVIFLLLSHFEGVAGIFHSLYPVIAGCIAMLGLMALTGMRLNFMNAMVLVTILGMGSDYGLHLAHRSREGREEERCAAFVQAGRAVLLSALTTIAGFGSLAFADYGALASIGWATNYGVGATALFALVSLPAFLRWRSNTL
ncbi:MAG: MMPL family transporter [Geobacter sp.]|nr:MMPL family transporter [Geobacter sp.]